MAAILSDPDRPPPPRAGASVRDTPREGVQPCTLTSRRQSNSGASPLVRFSSKKCGYDANVTEASHSSPACSPRGLRESTGPQNATPFTDRTSHGERDG